MNDQDDSRNDVFVADPADADPFFDEPELPGWPKVVGTISTVFAALGLVCGGLGAVGVFLQPTMMGSAAGQMEGGMPPQMTQVNHTLLVATIIGLAWAVFLLVGSIMCLLRKPVARPLLLAYAVGAIIITLWSVSVQMGIQDGIEQWVQDNPDADFSQNYSSSGQATGQLVGLVVGLTISLSWPAFCLFWFGFIKTKPEDFTGGADLDAI